MYATTGKAFEKQDLLKYSKDHYRKKGTGRPTKKDKHLSTKPIAKVLTKYLEEKVTFQDSFELSKNKIILIVWS